MYKRQLQAPQSDIEENLGQYMKGWDYTRTARHEQLKKLKILDSKWEITPRDSAVPEWKNSKHQNWEDLRMSVYAAQIKIMDQGIGKLLDTLKNLKINDNTIIMFLSDNGGCAEFLMEDPDPLNKYKLMDMGAKMTFDGNVDMHQMAFWQIILAAGPVLLIALAIGLFIGIFQAATSINEMTLSFVPKVIIVMLTLLLTANFVFISLSDYFNFIFEQISALN